MPEYSDKEVQDWISASNQIYEVIGQWKDANLLARNRDIDYMKRALISAREIPGNFVDEKLREKISILEQAVKILEEKDKSLAEMIFQF